MLSVKLVIVIGSTVLGFDTVTVNVNVPPGAGRVNGLATFVTPICGPVGVNETVACAVAVTVIPLFIPVTVTVSVCESPARPVNEPVKLHGELVAPGANVVPISAPHVLPASVAIFPYTLSVNAVIVTGVTVLGFETCTVNVNVPPGSTIVNGLATFVTAIIGAAATSVTVACAVAVAGNPCESTPFTVTVSVCESPAAPVNGPVKLHGALDAPGARTTPINVPHVLPARVAIFP
jgi:hypothetical protein